MKDKVLQKRDNFIRHRIQIISELNPVFDSVAHLSVPHQLYGPPDVETRLIASLHPGGLKRKFWHLFFHMTKN